MQSTIVRTLEFLHYANASIDATRTYVIERLPNGLYQLFDRCALLGSLHDTYHAAMLEAQRKHRNYAMR